MKEDLSTKRQHDNISRHLIFKINQNHIYQDKCEFVFGFFNRCQCIKYKEKSSDDKFQVIGQNYKLQVVLGLQEELFQQASRLVGPEDWSIFLRSVEKTFHEYWKDNDRTKLQKTRKWLLLIYKIFDRCLVPLQCLLRLSVYHRHSRNIGRSGAIEKWVRETGNPFQK